MADANAFDQFDDEAVTNLNPFDQFDEEQEEISGRTFGGKVLVNAIRAIGQGIAAEISAGLATGTVAAARSDIAEGVEVGEKTREKIQFEPSTQAGEVAVRGLGKLAEVVTGAVRKPFAGIAGIFNLPGGSEKAAEAVGRVQEEGVGSVLADALFEATGSPGIATAARTAPEAIGILAGTKGVGRAVKAVPEPVPRGTLDIQTGSVPRPLVGREPEISVGRPRLDEPVDVTPPSEIEQAAAIGKDVRRTKTTTVAEEVRPNPEIVAAADELGIELPASATSTNRAFQELEQAVKSQPGSKIAVKEQAAIAKVNERADEMIRDFGGTTDKSLLDDTIRNDFLSTIDDMEVSAKVAYKIVDDTIPKTHRIDLTQTENGVKAYLDNVLEELGGDISLLSAAERKLLTLTRTKGEGGKLVDRQPTYAALDRVRKDVGEGFNRRSGPFKDDRVANLKRVYAALSEEQQAVANFFTVGGDYARARGLVNKRKILEGEAQVILGRDLNSSIVPKLRAAATTLTKGDTSKFKTIMDSLPEGLRPEVAASMLSDIFASGSRTGSGVGSGFVKAFESLNRNSVAKNLLFSYLPKGAKRRFDLIGKVATGLFRAKALENNSRTARAILQALDDGGLMDKIYNVGRKAAVAETATTVAGLPLVGSSVVLAVNIAKKSTPAIIAADEFLASPVFARAIRLSGTGKTELANDIVTKSPRFQKWLKFADENSAGEIARFGFIAWLIGENK